ncbi:MAG: ribonuclease E/G [Gammaproteobacteria bacterium]
MTRRMLIDASQSEETRVVVLHGNRLEEFDYDSESKKQLKGNIYLAKVTRVEPSLQAAFVEYGGNRHGFLAFNEIHPDYYKIPVADRQQLLAEETAADDSEDSDEPENVETVGGDEFDEVDRRRTRVRRNYKIQEVTKRGQVMLVQVVKEERGNKGAALTTYLSLPGRYCVLMPNTGRGGGISRKISNARDRKRLKGIVDGLGIPEGMAVIVRTAGSERTKAELKRDFEYLMRLWDQIRKDTLESTAPSLIYEEANLIKRAIRDMYTKDIEDVLVEGEEGYRTAKDFMRTLMPSHAKRVQPYKNEGVPIFQRYQVEGQIDAIHSPEIKLRSGGYIVMHQTEALVAIDVNSGRATRERHIEETALKTNLEAADEVARQLRLRDMAGLIVIDFIDMEESRNNHSVERRLKDALRFDRARIQVGRISHFGLLEMSRQRLRPSLMEISSEICHYCGGSGYLQSVEWTGLHILRVIEEEALRRRTAEISVSMPAEVALYVLNHKRTKLHELEERYEIRILVVADNNLVSPNFNLDVVRGPGGAQSAERGEEGAQERSGRRRRRGRRRRQQDEDAIVEVAAEEETEQAADNEAAAAAEDGDGESGPKRRKRGRRGGRRRSRKSRAAENATAEAADADEIDSVAAEATDDETEAAEPRDEAPDAAEAEPERAAATGENDDAEAASSDEESEAEAEKTPRKRARPRRRRRSTAAAKTETAEAIEAAPEPEAEVVQAVEDTAEDVAADAAEAEDVIPEDEPIEQVAISEEPEPEPEPAPIELPAESVAALPAEEVVAAENGANGRDEASESDESEETETPAIASETPAEKKTGWWNRNW